MLRAIKDPEHEKKINALIPEAVRLADDDAVKFDVSIDWGKLFMAKMNTLAIAKGLRVSGKTLWKMRKEMNLNENH